MQETCREKLRLLKTLSKLLVMSTKHACLRIGITLFNSPPDVENNEWILDSRATDHMTFDATDFTEPSLPQRTSIANINGVISPVTGDGTITLSPALPLYNTMLLPSLSHKLLFELLLI